VTPPGALWRIYDFDLSKNHPPVQQLQLHLPDMHIVAFHKRDKLEQIINRPGVEESMLTVYFNANRHHEEACGILY
jgi:ATP-dependent DNA helicase PIF1